MSIPRYYEKWLKKNQPEKWEDYVRRTKARIIKCAQERSMREKNDWLKDYETSGRRPITQEEHKRKIAKSNFKLLAEKLKL